jgi:hypothetical protein
MYRRSYLVRSVFAVLALSPVAASAHPGPRIWVNVEGGQVTTYAGAYPPGDPSAYGRARVFTQPLADDSGVFDTDFPGYQQVPGGSIPTNTNFSYDMTGPLLWYDPATASRAARFRTVANHFGAAPPVPQMAVTNELFQTKVSGDDFVAGDLAYAYNGGAGDHNHLTYTLLGDGQTAGGGADGIYVLPLRLTSPGYDPSDTFFLLLGKNAADADLNDAAALAGQTLILPGDANTDGVVNFADYQHLELGFGKGDPGWADGDFNCDGVVDIADFRLLYDNYGRRADGASIASAAPPPLPDGSMVPEPVGAASIACALTASLLPRRVRRGDRRSRPNCNQPTV